MKLISLLKAVLSQDMNMFKYSVGKNASKLKKVSLPLLLFLIVSISIGNVLVIFIVFPSSEMLEDVIEVNTPTNNINP